jgi:hypothetical protein
MKFYSEMYKKFSLIFFLAFLLAAFLFVRHFWTSRNQEPLMIDRIPSGDILIRANILDVARETSGMLHHNKIPFRDFFSQEFLLGQAKSYGLNFQRPVYLFADESGEWGGLIHVTDSSKIMPGLMRLQKIKSGSDTTLFNQKVYYWPKEKIYLSYGKSYLFVYKGSQFRTKLFQIVFARKGEINPAWKDFLGMKMFKNENLVLYSNSKKLMKYGVEKAMFSHDSDSTSLTMKAYIKSLNPFSFKKKESGLALASNPGDNKFLNLHLDIDGFRTNQEDPLYRLMVQMSKKISFPLKAFLSAWEGDLSFRQGGTQKVSETYIESELDDNFIVTEVEKVREKLVPGFSVALSLNQNGSYLLQRLQQKGILTQENEKYRFLGSPPLSSSRQGNYYLFSSGEKKPNLMKDNLNNGIWKEKGTKFIFYLDSLNGSEAFGELHFPVNRLIQRNKFF